MKPSPAVTALRKSVEHWKDVARDPVNTLIGPDECALCNLYFDKMCNGCPVRDDTGLDTCEGTPYSEFGNAKWDYEHGLSAITIPTLVSLAKKEIEFLENLLKKRVASELEQDVPKSFIQGMKEISEGNVQDLDV